MTNLERSHVELRAGLHLAVKKIEQLNNGEGDTTLVRNLRALLREAGTASVGVYQLPITGKKPGELSGSNDAHSR